MALHAGKIRSDRYQRSGEKRRNEPKKQTMAQATLRMGGCQAGKHEIRLCLAYDMVGSCAQRFWVCTVGLKWKNLQNWEFGLLEFIFSFV